MIFIGTDNEKHSIQDFHKKIKKWFFKQILSDRLERIKIQKGKKMITLQQFIKHNICLLISATYLSKWFFDLQTRQGQIFRAMSLRKNCYLMLHLSFLDSSNLKIYAKMILKGLRSQEILRNVSGFIQQSMFHRGILNSYYYWCTTCIHFPDWEKCCIKWCNSELTWKHRKYQVAETEKGNLRFWNRFLKHLKPGHSGGGFFPFTNVSINQGCFFSFSMRNRKAMLFYISNSS